MIEAWKLSPGETIMWAQKHDNGGYVVRVRAADGIESLHDIYPGQSAPEVEAFIAREEAEQDH